jgi:hypothetical protein
VDAAGEPLEDKGTDPRSTLTSNGRVSIRRKRYQATEGGGVMPVDALLDAAEATVSLGARELCCRLNATGTSVERTVDQLKHAAQLSVGKTLLREVVEAEGKRVLAASESGALKPQWRANQCKVKTPAGKEVSRAYVGIDGFMVPLLTEEEKCKRRRQVTAARAKRPAGKPALPPLPRRKSGADERYKEFKLVQFHDEEMTRRLVSVTRKACGEAGRILRRDARRIGFEQADERLANVDGGPWIFNILMNWTVVLTALCLDFWHLGQNVNQGKRVTFGENDASGVQWASDLMHCVRHEGYEPFWDQLVRWRGKQRGSAKRKEANRLLNYVSCRQEMIVYERCERNGWRISSSTTESECAAAPHRVKGSGKRWDADNAEAVIALETLHQSNLWNQYWATRAAQTN